MTDLSFIQIDLENILEKIEHYKSIQGGFDNWSEYEEPEETEIFSPTFSPLFSEFNEIIKQLKTLEIYTFKSIRFLSLNSPFEEIQTDVNMNYYKEFYYTTSHLTELEFEIKKTLKYLKINIPEKQLILNEPGVTFVSEDRLNSSIIEMIKQSKEFVTLITPYIKLHQRVKDALSLKKDIKPFELIILYGKNPKNKTSSFSKKDKDYLKTIFSKLKIHYKERLHAKCYFSEKEIVLTSMNLYDFSQNNNIEFGICVKKESNPDLYSTVIDYFKSVINSSEKEK